MLQVMTFSIGVIESDTVSTSNMPPLPLCEIVKIQNQLFFARRVFEVSKSLSLCKNFKIVVAVQKFQNLESTSFLPGEFCPKAAELEDGYDLFVQDGEVLLLISIHDHL